MLRQEAAPTSRGWTWHTGAAPISFSRLSRSIHCQLCILREEERVYLIQSPANVQEGVDRKKQELDEFHPVPIMLCRLFSRWLDLQLLQPLVYNVPRPNRVLAVMAYRSIAPDDIF